MQFVSPKDFRAAARRRLPRFLFDYIDGGALDEYTKCRNTRDLKQVQLPQRVLSGAAAPDTTTHLLGNDLSMPVILGPVGLTGMYDTRGEVQAARAALDAGIPFTLSTVSVCSIEEVRNATSEPFWFQLYVLKDRAFMRDTLRRAAAAGIRTLIFTVDLPATGIRYGEMRWGLSAGPLAALRRALQAATHPRWTWRVGYKGRPHTLGNISAYWGRESGLGEYNSWLEENFDPTISIADLAAIRREWSGTLIVKGVLSPEDAQRVVEHGADAIVVSNHGGRQLDGAPSTISALPGIVERVAGQVPVLLDSGIRNGADIARALHLGADAVLIGRLYAYALAARGEAGVRRLLELLHAELCNTMTLMGVDNIPRLKQASLEAA